MRWGLEETVVMLRVYLLGMTVPQDTPNNPMLKHLKFPLKNCNKMRFTPVSKTHLDLNFP